ncbi:phosphoesterase RecJ domain-containing protein [Desulfonispora thiosulfatigenes DSM 11270]|uniref:Phosphoesterase RecJ domain-containing protein n=1 Tax=Desulfonispora thiosulfatigenes DSM 11270 TaxID=656914 RepID=A0A1W1VLK6_DESTI|nr:bifunctional oligoribonuclease/PAP phosphatase NrnA [Desulfonispora thiosulfatigenes]SMB94100.1 phosphoesterase RecJ domain-containing protein [Desulfonispora thiosulfatigenes DSM 11270]
MDIQKIIDKLANSKEVGIISHLSPDGDALGSQLALALGLEKMGIKTILINKDFVPENLSFLPSSQSIKPLESFTNIPEVLVFVDCATMERTGYDTDDINTNKIFTINIDHHISNSNFARYNLVKNQAAATAEIIYDLLSLLQIKMDKNIATSLYTGLSTDTGSFMYDNVTPTTHKVAADLIKYGADTSKVRVNFYENMSRNKVELLKQGLSNLNFSVDGRIAWIAYDLKSFEELNLSSTDADGMISYVKNISEVEVAMVFKEVQTNLYKVSMRSKSWFDVNELASLFDGGGHVRAAGCTIKGEINENIKKIVESCQQIMMRGGF